MRILGDKLINVTGGIGSSISCLVLGDNKTALLDCGMAYCAEELAENIKLALPPGRKLDYILLSHSHYDHIGAIPCIRKHWPKVKVLAADYARAILQKPSALKTIKQYGQRAAAYYGAGSMSEYDDELLKVDQVIRDGSQLDLGGLTIKVLETPGHTKCSLSFLINGEVIYASETTGVANKDGIVLPTFINSLKQAVRSIDKCRNTEAKIIIEAHNGHVKDSSGYWDRCMKAVEWACDLVNTMQLQGADEDKIYNEYKKIAYKEDTESIQPEFAFEINNRAMIRTIMQDK